MPRKIGISALLPVVLLCGAFAAPAARADGLLAPESACPGQTAVDSPIKVQARAMLCMHRYAREAAGKPDLHRTGRLRRSAKAKGRDVLSCQDFSHTACGRDAFYWFEKVGYLKGCVGAGENLSMGYGDVRSAMEGWLDSPSHRRNILDDNYREAGFGLVKGNYPGFGDTQVWVAHFGYHC